MSASACGKRGDPLPPLRPFPGTAQGLTIRQVGDQITLTWQAPTQNTDGTIEKLELSEVEVRRRIIDIAALVEEQTETIEPEEPGVLGSGETGAEESEPELLPESESQSPPPAAAASAVGAANPAEAVLADDEPASDTPDIEEEPQAPPIPVLVIPNFAPESRDVATLESVVPGETNSYSEQINPMWIGRRVEYAVVYTNRAGRRGARTTTVQIEPVAPLATPGQPAAETGDGFVALHWSVEPPEGAGLSATGVEASPSYFSVFRRSESAATYPSRALNGEPLVEASFVDRSIAFGDRACYVVKQVAAPPPKPAESAELDQEAIEESPEAPLPTDVPPAVATVIVPEIPPIKNSAPIESEPSPEVCLVPVDTFAPPSPVGLVAVRSGDDVLLTWTEVERPDISGYRVYRGESADGPFARLNETLSRVPTYTDNTVDAGATYYYGITAVDDAPAANESEMSELSDVTFVRR